MFQCAQWLLVPLSLLGGVERIKHRILQRIATRTNAAKLLIIRAVGPPEQ